MSHEPSERRGVALNLSHVHLQKRPCGLAMAAMSCQASGSQIWCPEAGACRSESTCATCVCAGEGGPQLFPGLQLAGQQAFISASNDIRMFLRAHDEWAAVGLHRWHSGGRWPCCSHHAASSSERAMCCAQCAHEVKPEPSCGTFQELNTLVGIDVDPTALELATARLKAQKPPATQLHLLPGNVRCARSSASGFRYTLQ